MKGFARTLAAAVFVSALAAGSAVAETQDPPSPAMQKASDTASGIGTQIEIGAQRAAHALVIAAGDAWAATKAGIAAGSATIRARADAREKAEHAFADPTIPTNASR